MSLSRARSALIIAGNADKIKADPKAKFLSAIWDYCHDKGWSYNVEGDILTDVDTNVIPREHGEETLEDEQPTFDEQPAPDTSTTWANISETDPDKNEVPPSADEKPTKVALTQAMPGARKLDARIKELTESRE